MGLTKTERRNRIKRRVRKVVSGTSATPRLSVFRSNRDMYAQLINDIDHFLKECNDFTDSLKGCFKGSR